MPPSAVLNDGNIAIIPQDNGSKDKSFMLNRHLHAPPKKVVKATGNYLTLDSGQDILDATGGAAVACLGHGNARVKKAMIAQMDEVSYCHSLFFSCSSGEELAKLLINSTGGRMARAFIVSSGTEMSSVMYLCCGSSTRTNLL
jgi:adenosylmethionine-8-amino-7-oxononanoate aminotransferase